MKNQNSNFINFNGKTINLVFAENQWWIAIKPICEALQTDYNRQFQNIKNDEILLQLFATQQTTGTDGKIYKMICLPEKYIYGWLFSIRSESKDLKAYKLKCYEILYGHFHGLLTNRRAALQQLNEIDKKIDEAKKEIEQNEHYLIIENLRESKKNVQKSLKEYDETLQNGQLSIFQ